jgi:hypothetical protein
MLLKIGYLALTFIISIIIIAISFQAIDKTFTDRSQNISKKIKVVLGLLLWNGYMLVLHFMEILNNFEFPPRFAILLIFPAFIFTGVFLYRNRNSQWIQHIPTSALIFYQTLRIAIESLFVFTVSAKLMHANVTIEGYNYDMVFGFTALLVGIGFVFNKISIQLIRLWNYLGLAVIAVIIFLFMTTIYMPQMYGQIGPLMPLDITYYPYLLVPGFLMPSAVFVHVLSLVKLKGK